MKFTCLFALLLPLSTIGCSDGGNTGSGSDMMDSAGGMSTTDATPTSTPTNDTGTMDMGDNTAGQSGGSALPMEGLGLFPLADVSASLQCATCHGTLGLGTPLAPNIQHPVRNYYTWVIRNGRSGHPEYPAAPMAPYDATVLSDDTLNQILDFLAAEPQPTTGEGLYMDYCSNCHGADARGGVTGQSIAGVSFGEMLEAIREGENLALFDDNQRSSYMPSWTQEELTTDDVLLINDYVDTL